MAFEVKPCRFILMGMEQVNIYHNYVNNIIYEYIFENNKYEQVHIYIKAKPIGKVIKVKSYYEYG